MLSDFVTFVSRNPQQGVETIKKFQEERIKKDQDSD
jgi:hypothetical protein